LFSLVDLRRFIAHKSLHNEFEELFQAPELRTVSLLYGTAQFRRKPHLTGIIGH
jgi:hypothetical protein